MGGGNNAAEETENSVVDKDRVVANESHNADEGHIVVDTEGEVVVDFVFQ